VVVPSLVMAGVTTRGRAKVRVMARSRRSAGGKKVFDGRHGYCAVWVRSVLGGEVFSAGKVSSVGGRKCRSEMRRF
jgi:hypothetical protein